MPPSHIRGKPFLKMRDRDSKAAYSSSQPMFDALRASVTRASEQMSNLTMARNTVQYLHVKIVNNDDKNCTDAMHQRYMDNAVKAWAKEWSISSMKHLQNNMKGFNAPSLIESMKPFARIEKSIIPLGLGNDKAWVLLQAYMMHHIYSDVFEEPFFGLDERANTLKSTPKATKGRPSTSGISQNLPQLDGQSLKAFYDEIMERE